MPLNCEICNKELPYASALEIHIRTHTKEKPFICKICNKGFAQTSNLYQHWLIHTGGEEKPFVCESCNKGFSKRSHLSRHLQIHTNEKPFICHICNKGFAQKGHLKEHINFHTGEKPFSCELCSRRFFQKSQLKEHLRSHTGEKPFSCEVCNKMFTRKNYLNKHLRTVHMNSQSTKVLEDLPKPSQFFSDTKIARSDLNEGETLTITPVLNSCVRPTTRTIPRSTKALEDLLRSSTPSHILPDIELTRSELPQEESLRISSDSNSSVHYTALTIPHNTKVLEDLKNPAPSKILPDTEMTRPELPHEKTLRISSDSNSSVHYTALTIPHNTKVLEDLKNPAPSKILPDTEMTRPELPHEKTLRISSGLNSCVPPTTLAIPHSTNVLKDLLKTSTPSQTLSDTKVIRS